MMTVFLTIKHEPLNLREGRGLYTVGPLIPMFKRWPYIFSNRAKSVTATLDSVD